MGIATDDGGFGFILPNGVQAVLHPGNIAERGVTGVSLGVAPRGVNRDCVVDLNLVPIDQLEEDEVDLTAEPSEIYPTPREADAWLLRPAPGPAESVLVIPVEGWVGTVGFSEGDACPPEEVARALATLQIRIDPDRNMPVVEPGELATVAARVPPKCRSRL
ncbi:MAG: hypothetical protein WD651_01205 [Acidimicrobiia bacterium]